MRTATGNWRVTYNSANRPTTFTREEEGGATEITCTYDSMDRRATKKSHCQRLGNPAPTLHLPGLPPNSRLRPGAQRRSPPVAHHWDSTQEQATCPLAIRKDGTWYCYGWDLTKNISEVYKNNGGIGPAYSYASYRSGTARGSITQPLQWRSEYMNTELGLVYYNYRHYNPSIGRWISRDPIGHGNIYSFVDNKLSYSYDILGLEALRICKKDRHSKGRKDEYGQEMCKFDCERPPGYMWTDRGTPFSTIYRPCSEPDVITSGTCSKKREKQEETPRDNL